MGLVLGRTNRLNDERTSPASSIVFFFSFFQPRARFSPGAAGAPPVPVLPSFFTRVMVVVSPFCAAAVVRRRRLKVSIHSGFGLWRRGGCLHLAPTLSSARARVARVIRTAL